MAGDHLRLLLQLGAREKHGEEGETGDDGRESRRRGALIGTGGDVLLQGPLGQGETGPISGDAHPARPIQGYICKRSAGFWDQRRQPDTRSPRDD